MKVKVKVPKDAIYIFPKKCSCCLEPTDETKKIGKLITKHYATYAEQESISVDIPLCKKCQGHRMPGCIPFLIIAVILFSIIGHYASKIPPNSSLDSPPAIIIFCLLFLSLGLPTIYFLYHYLIWPHIHTGHAKAKDQVLIKTEDDHIIAFIFYNSDYGKIFIENNKKIIIE